MGLQPRNYTEVGIRCGTCARRRPAHQAPLVALVRKEPGDTWPVLYLWRERDRYSIAAERAADIRSAVRQDNDPERRTTERLVIERQLRTGRITLDDVAYPDWEVTPRTKRRELSPVRYGDPANYTESLPCIRCHRTYVIGVSALMGQAKAAAAAGRRAVYLGARQAANTSPR